jgi:hypothetical protein
MERGLNSRERFKRERFKRERRKGHLYLRATVHEV